MKQKKNEKRKEKTQFDERPDVKKGQRESREKEEIRDQEMREQEEKGGKINQREDILRPWREARREWRKKEEKEGRREIIRRNIKIKFAKEKEKKGMKGVKM